MLSDGKTPPRPQQIEIDVEVKRLFAAGYEIVGLNLPPGYGKSYLARAWQREAPQTDILTCSNHLIDQYTGQYPELNAVKGRKHYATAKEYEDAKRIARGSTPSIFNPLSALFTCPRETRPAKRIIVDEAHTLGEMLRNAATVSLNASKTGLSRGSLSEYQLTRWVSQRFHELTRQMKFAAVNQREFEQIAALYYAVAGHDQDSVFELRRSRTVVRGRIQENLSVDVVDYPLGLIAQVLNSPQVILMSGTLTKYETERLANGRKWVWVSRPYLPPAVNRPVFVQPVEDIDRKNTPKLAAQIRRIYEEGGRAPTLVHLTYAEVDIYEDALRDLRPILHRTSKEKGRAEKRFRNSGGLWLAAGCAEGIDLPDNLCRAIIIPTLQFPNKGDMYVQKRLSRPDGNRWYCIKTLENTIQRLGRGLRHIDDYCRSFILDPYFPRLWDQYGEEFEALAIQWGSR